MTHRSRDDTGSATIELVLTIPVLLLALWFLVFCGRMAGVRLLVEDAAHQAARAASSQRTEATAAAHARSTAAQALHGAGITCRGLAVRLQGSLQPGGTVQASVTCDVDLSGLAPLRVPGVMALSAEFASPVDVYRGSTLAHSQSETAEHIAVPRVASASASWGAGSP
ncbi:TadE family protein [Streptomyces endophyticus]|uniref:Pilus assembly protein n=1 Tax=Streptomyces endophyticus TaxID=714166 RepID=A0ABU6F201_9ACTN|nr:TadE family protein [Streptomyces endophyticus]MEB8338045.1 pilus assembly protein [Streptomyces endophyticus]